MIRDKGSTFGPNTKMSAKIGPVTPAQWILTFQNKLITIKIVVTKVYPNASKRIILVPVAKKRTPADA